MNKLYIDDVLKQQARIRHQKEKELIDAKCLRDHITQLNKRINELNVNVITEKKRNELLSMRIEKYAKDKFENYSL